MKVIQFLFCFIIFILFPFHSNTNNISLNISAIFLHKTILIFFNISTSFLMKIVFFIFCYLAFVYWFYFLLSFMTFIVLIFVRYYSLIVELVFTFLLFLWTEFYANNFSFLLSKILLLLLNRFHLSWPLDNVKLGLYIRTEG